MSSGEKINDNTEGNGNINIESARNVNIYTYIDKRAYSVLLVALVGIFFSICIMPFYTSLLPKNSHSTIHDRQESSKRSLKTTDQSHVVLKEKLQQQYRRITLPKVAWLDGGYDLPLDDYFIKLQLRQSNASIEVTEIFNPVNSKKPLRILIEGQPGFGKTTLACKMAFDWARNKKYINHFKLVFFVPLRDLGLQTIQEAILQIGQRVGYQNASNIIPIVNSNEQDTLFILDGLDEITLGHQQNIIKLLYSQSYSKATLVVFCRTGLFEFTKEERKQLFGQINVVQRFYDKYITILGIQSLQDKLLFLKKMNIDPTVKNISEHLLINLPLFNSPLLLMMLPVVLEEEENTKPYSSKTQFYKRLFNCVLKHSYVKRGLNIDSNFDLFHYDTSPNTIQTIMRDFGILSVENIIKNKLTFESADLTKEIYQLGFLLNHKEMSHFRSKNHYETLHLSFIEFTAAFALWLHLKFDKSATTEKLLEPVINHFVDTEGTSQILLFLANMMEDDLDHFLTLIDLYSGWLCLHSELTTKLLLDCSPNSICNSKYLRNHIQSKDKALYCAGVVRNLLLHQSGCSSETFTYVDLILSHPLRRDEIFINCLHFGKTTIVDHCGLATIVTSSNTIKYCFLQITITNKIEKQFVIELLEKNQVQNLELKGYSELNMSDFSLAVARSDYLTSLSVRDVTIDLYDLTNGGTKRFNFLGLNHCNLTCRQPLISPIYCDYLKIHNVKTVKEITEIEPAALECNYVELNNLIAKYPTWSGFNTVKYLSFHRYNQICRISPFVWKHLTTLHIRLDQKSNDEDALAKCIENLSMTTLVVSKPYAFSSNLIKNLKILIVKQKNSRLKTISVFYWDELSKSETFVLLEGLFLKYWDTSSSLLWLASTLFIQWLLFIVLNVIVFHFTPQNISFFQVFFPSIFQSYFLSHFLPLFLAFLLSVVITYLFRGSVSSRLQQWWNCNNKFLARKQTRIFRPTKQNV